MAEYRDPTPISPKEPEYDKSKVSTEVANYTQQVRENKKGHDVREALARNSEIADIKAEDAVATSYDTKARQDDVENRFDDQIAGNTDVDEVIDARRPEGEEAYPTLRKRLDEEHQEVTAQLAQTTAYVHLASFPLLAGETDDTQRIKRAIQATEEGETLFLRHESEPFIVSDTIIVDKNIHFVCENDVVYEGIRDRPAFVFLGLNDCKINLKIVSDGDTYVNYNSGYHGWENNNYIGVVLENLKDCTVNIEEVRNFTVGVKAKASNGRGFWFNDVTIRSLQNNKRLLELNQDGINSWMNSNNFYTASLTYTGGSEFTNATVDRYGIIQTLTNGNQYKSNSNTFNHFKFESNDAFNGSVTWVKIVYADSWKFVDYRYEVTNPMTFAEIDLSINLESYDRGISSHTFGILFEPLMVQGSKEYHAIKYTNTENIKDSYENVAKIVGNPKTLLLSENLLADRAIRYTSNHSLIAGLYRKAIADETLSDERVFQYGTAPIVKNNGVSIAGGFPVVIYLTNLQRGDEITVIRNFTSSNKTNLIFKVFDLDDNIMSVGKPVAATGKWKANKAFYTASAINRDSLSVNDENVGTVAILITGEISGFSILTTNPEVVLKKSMSGFDQNRLYVHSVPTENTNFLIGDIVYNSNKTSGQPIGWELKSSGWESIALY